MALTPPQAYDVCSLLLASAGTGPDGYMKHIGIVVEGRPVQRLIKLNELADYLGVERTTVYRCGILDQIKVVRVAACVLYDIVEVDAWIAAQKNSEPIPSTRQAKRT